jgi:nucleoside-diphosphate-sugar epimerase
MPRILVTGASGFIGRRLVRRLLEESLDVSVLVRTEEQADEFRAQGCEARVGYLTSPSTLKGVADGIGQVVHLAASTSLHTRSKAELAVNDEGTRNLLAALNGSASLERFVLMSSTTAVARKRGSRLGRPLDATSNEIPDTPYGRSKREAEESTVRALEGSSVEWVILRPPLVYGPGSKPAGGMNVLVGLAKRPGLAGRLDFTGRISVIHVDDLVDVCLLAMRGGIPSGRAIYASDGEPVTFGHVIRTACEILGVRRRLLPIGWACAITRALYDGLDVALGISRWIPADTLGPMGFSMACESDDLRELGFEPRHSLRSGLTQTLKG